MNIPVEKAKRVEQHDQRHEVAVQLSDEFLLVDPERRVLPGTDLFDYAGAGGARRLDRELGIGHLGRSHGHSRPLATGEDRSPLSPGQTVLVFFCESVLVGLLSCKECLIFFSYLPP